jgi:hypothetical protein
MPLNLKSTGGGGIILNPNATPTDVTLNLPATAGTLATAETLATASGASGVGYLPGGTGAVATTVQEQNRKSIFLFDFMSAAQIADVQSATPALDHTASIQAFFNACVGRRGIVNDTKLGYYRVTSQLTLPNNFVTIEWESTAGVFKKFFNGDMIRVNGGEVELVRCGIDGNGGTYTGGGIVLTTTSANSFRLISPRIKFTADSPLLIESDAGSLLKVIGGLLQPQNATYNGTPSVRMTGTDTVPNNRKLIGMSTGGNPIMDLGGAETTNIVGCDGSYVITNSNSKKLTLVGNRLQSAGATILISGLDHCITGNTVASGFELMSGASNCVVADNTVAGGYSECIDSSGNSTNRIDVVNQAYTPTWTAGTTNPAIGNGSLSGFFIRKGQTITATIGVAMGSTTTFGAGEYAFAIPITSAASSIAYVGSVWALNSGVSYRVGSAIIVPGSTSVSVYFDNGGTSMSPTQPHTWKNGDTLRIQITYSI